MEDIKIDDEKRNNLLNRVDNSYLCNISKQELKKTINALHNIIRNGLFKPCLPFHLNYLIKSNSYHEANNVIKIIKDIVYTYKIDNNFNSYNLNEIYNDFINLSSLINKQEVEKVIRMSNANIAHSFVLEKQTHHIKKRKVFFILIYMKLASYLIMSIFFWKRTLSLMREMKIFL